MPAELQAGLASEIRLRRSDDRPVLTPRELDIIRLAADGHSNAEIGLRLHVSTATVKTHLQHIFEKLEVSDRSAAVAQALRRGCSTMSRSAEYPPRSSRVVDGNVSRARASIRGIRRVTPLSNPPSAARVSTR